MEDVLHDFNTSYDSGKTMTIFFFSVYKNSNALTQALD
jgi:hypothetical protein